MKSILKIAILAVLPLGSYAQSETDVYRYSHTTFGGTARYNSVAGAFGAVGADFSVLSTNPGGMGRFRTSDFSFTPTLNLSNTTSTHNGMTAVASKENFNINNIGIVLVSRPYAGSETKWRALQFGFGYNKLANFHETYHISSIDSTSLSMVLADQGYGATEEELYNGYVAPFTASPAYNAWLIDPLNGSGGKEVFTTQMYVDSIQQDHKVTNRGSLGEWSLAMSGNYNDKFYIGASVNFQRFTFEQEKAHTETSLIDTTEIYNFTYIENLTTVGRGVNLKVGGIYLPTPWLRVGLSYHTPTAYYTMRDRWNTAVETNFRDTTTYRTSTSYYAESPNGSFIYKMRTPARLMGSLAVVIKKKGMISADVEFTNYSSGLLRRHDESGDSYSFELENQKVSENFASVINLRVGGEYRLTNLWMLRAGVAYYQNGYNSGVVSQTNPMLTYAGGFGYRARSFYADFAYTLSTSARDYYMYDPILSSTATISKRSTNVMATIGFKF